MIVKYIKKGIHNPNNNITEVHEVLSVDSTLNNELRIITKKFTTTIKRDELELVLSQPRGD